MQRDEEWRIPILPFQLTTVISQLRGLARGGLQDENEGEGEQVKGLKFISGKLVKLFDRNKKLKYNHISHVLIDNFSSQSNDSRNIKRRVYDAINVMVAVGLFQKDGDSLEKKEEQKYRERVDQIMTDLSKESTQRQTSLAIKKKILANLIRRKNKMEELIQRNKVANHKTKITNPVFLNIGDNVERINLLQGEQGGYKMNIRRQGKRKGRQGRQTALVKEQEYLQHL